jgi:hypothetical protein
MIEDACRSQARAPFRDLEPDERIRGADPAVWAE